MAIGSVLSGIGSLLGGVSSLGSLFGSDDTDYQRHESWWYQNKLQESNNAFQSSENAKARAWQKDMFDYEFAKTADFNSYKNMVSRALEAGISPSTLFGNGSPALMGGMSAPATSHSASPSPSYGDIVNPVNRRVESSRMLADSFGSVASGLSALAQATKTGVETGHIGSLMSAQMKNQLSQAGFNDIQTSSQDFELGLRKIFGKQLYSSEVGRNFAQMTNSFAQAYLAAEEGNTQESVRELNKAKRLYNDALRSCTDRQREQIELEMSWFPREMQAKIDNLRASAEESRAVAQNQLTQADLNRVQKSIAELTKVDVVEGVRLQTENLSKEGKILDSQVEAARAAAEQAKYAESHKEWIFWKDYITDIISTGISAVTSYKSMRAFQTLSNAQQKRVELQIEDLQGKYGDTHQDTFIKYDDQGRKHTITNTYNRSGQRYKGKY